MIVAVQVAALAMMFLQTANVSHAALQNPSCDDFNHPDKTQGYIITVLEEQIGQTNSSSGNVKNCFRQTTTDSTTNQTTTTYTITCNPDSATCQRVQIFFTKSGAELLYTYVGTIYKWAAGTIGIVTVLLLVWGGIEISTAGGDQGKTEKAKERIIQSLAGLVLLFLSALILYTINPNFFTAG